MDTTQRAGLLQRWSVVQEELIPELGREVEGLTPRLTKLIHTLEWARIEEFVPAWQGIGRPPKDRSALANAENRIRLVLLHYCAPTFSTACEIKYGRSFDPSCN